jgi:hypothetical protein
MKNVVARTMKMKRPRRKRSIGVPASKLNIQNFAVDVEPVTSSQLGGAFSRAHHVIGSPTRAAVDNRGVFVPNPDFALGMSPLAPKNSRRGHELASPAADARHQWNKACLDPGRGASGRALKRPSVYNIG